MRKTGARSTPSLVPILCSRWNLDFQTSRPQTSIFRFRTTTRHGTGGTDILPLGSSRMNHPCRGEFPSHSEQTLRFLLLTGTIPDPHEIRKRIDPTWSPRARPRVFGRNFPSAVGVRSGKCSEPRQEVASLDSSVTRTETTVVSSGLSNSLNGVPTGRRTSFASERTSGPGKRERESRRNFYTRRGTTPVP